MDRRGAAAGDSKTPWGVQERHTPLGRRPPGTTRSRRPSGFRLPLRRADRTPQQSRHFFLNVDDDFRFTQFFAEVLILATKLLVLLAEGTALGLGPALLWRQGMQAFRAAPPEPSQAGVGQTPDCRHLREAEHPAGSVDPARGPRLFDEVQAGGLPAGGSGRHQIAHWRSFRSRFGAFTPTTAASTSITWWPSCCTSYSSSRPNRGRGTPTTTDWLRVKMAPSCGSTWGIRTLPRPTLRRSRASSKSTSTRT